MYWGLITDPSYTISASLSPSFEMSARASTSGTVNAELGFTDRSIDDDLTVRPNNAIVFKIDGDQIWEAMVRSGGSVTAGASLSALAVSATDFHRFRADVDATTSPNSVRFYIDDVLQATVQTANAVPSAKLTMSASSYEASPGVSGALDIKHIQAWIDDPDKTLLEINGSRIVDSDKPLDLTTTANVSENYQARNPALFDEGDVVALDTTYTTASVIQASVAYDSHVIGVVTRQSGVTLGVSNKSTIPVAVSGRAAVKISTANGTIKRGDFLTTSDKPGIAMKATGSGRVIGIALENFDGTELKTAAEQYLEETLRDNDLRGKQRMILMRISPEWYDASNAINSISNITALGDAIASASQGLAAERNLRILAAGLTDVAKKTYGITIGKGLLKIQRIAADIIEVNHGTVADLEVINGISLHDSITKNPYCVTINNGAMQTVPGLCATPIPPLDIVELGSVVTAPLPTPTSSTTPTSMPSLPPSPTPTLSESIMPTVEATITISPSITPTPTFDISPSESIVATPEISPTGTLMVTQTPIPINTVTGAPASTVEIIPALTPSDKVKDKDKKDETVADLSAQVGGGFGEYAATLASIIASIISRLTAWIGQDLPRLFN